MPERICLLILPPLYMGFSGLFKKPESKGTAGPPRPKTAMRAGLPVLDRCSRGYAFWAAFFFLSLLLSQMAYAIEAAIISQMTQPMGRVKKTIRLPFAAEMDWMK